MSAPAPARATPATTAEENLVLISADCHAGAPIDGYRDYLESRYHERFDAWRGRYKNPFRDLQGGTRNRNWDDERRISDQAADGVVAEVTFPNTVPPFFPTGALIARQPTADEYELRLAGIRAHNRWLADWCSRHPDRRAGIAQIFLNNVDDAVADVRWAREHGLRGGVLLPTLPPDAKHIAPLHAPDYDPLWAVCEELEMPVNNHGGGGLPDYGAYPAAAWLWLAETPMFSRRPLTQLIVSGVFERFPDLRMVVTEQGCAWVPPLLAQLDMFHGQMTSGGRVGELKFTADQLLPHKPSDYFRRNVWMGVSFPSPVEAAARRKIGIDRFMWGSDYPHHESTFPYTREGLRRAFPDTSAAELQQLLGGNAAHVYGFDMSRLAPLAAGVGPTAAEISRPLDAIPSDATSPAFFRD
jgi:predicted TIM-barrel fold metal-dependent hydrolase